MKEFRSCCPTASGLGELEGSLVSLIIILKLTANTPLEASFRSIKKCEKLKGELSRNNFPERIAEGSRNV